MRRLERKIKHIGDLFTTQLAVNYFRHEYSWGAEPLVTLQKLAEDFPTSNSSRNLLKNENDGKLYLNTVKSCAKTWSSMLNGKTVLKDAALKAYILKFILSLRERVEHPAWDILSRPFITQSELNDLKLDVVARFKTRPFRYDPTTQKLVPRKLRATYPAVIQKNSLDGLYLNLILHREKKLRGNYTQRNNSDSDFKESFFLLLRMISAEWLDVAAKKLLRLIYLYYKINDYQTITECEIEKILYKFTDHEIFRLCFSKIMADFKEPLPFQSLDDYLKNNDKIGRKTFLELDNEYGYNEIHNQSMIFWIDHYSEYWLSGKLKRECMIDRYSIMYEAIKNHYLHEQPLIYI